jgi:glycosyltransferase involved in cell wall biosynthesis
LNPNNPRCSVIIPVFGDGRYLQEIVSRIDSSFNSEKWKQPQIVLVDDCGSCESWEIITTLCNSRTNTIGIQLMRNFGQHNAIMCGFHNAHGDVIVTMDDDLQHAPESVADLVRTLHIESVDVVYGAYDKKKHTKGRNLGSFVVNWFYRRVFGLPITVSSFRAIDRKLVQAILRYELNFTFIDGLLAWNTRRISTTIVPHHPRADGKSSYSLTKLVALAMNMFTNFSLLPLQAVSFLGILAAAGGIGLGLAYLLLAIFSKIAVPGYASTIIAVLVLGGLQLLSLGIIGEYIGRLHLNVNRKPQFTIRSRVESCSNNKPIIADSHKESTK